MEHSAIPSSKIGLINNYEIAANNFAFRKRNERIDWKKLASIDVIKLRQDLDFHILQDNIVHVTFCDIEREMDETVDPNYIKLFILAQLIIEYLLHSQEYLANVIQLMEENLKQTSESLEEEKNARAKDQKFIYELRKENKKRKLQLTSQQQYFEAVCKEGSQCSYCPKVFVGPSYLQSHVMRRHPEFAKESQSDVDFSEQQKLKIATLEKELQEIKEKMKAPEPKFTMEKSVQVFQEEQQNYGTDNEILKSIEDWKKEELTRHKDELTHERNLLKNELKALQEKHEKSESALLELKNELKALQEKHEKSESAFSHKKYAKINDSHLESIENSLQHKNLLMEKENDEVAALKEQLKTKVNHVESIEKKLKRKEREWKANLKNVIQEHASEIDKLNINLNNTIAELNIQREKSALREKQYEEQIDDMIKSQIQEQSKKQEKENENAAKSKGILLPSPKDTPPPAPPRTYVASRIVKSPSKERNILIAVKSHRVEAALQSSPNLLDGLRTELNGLLHDKLKAYGISTLPATASAIRKASAAAKAERNALCKKYESFEKIRDHFEQLVDETGKNKLRKQEIDSSSQEPESIARKIIHCTKVKSTSTPKSSPTSIHISSPNSKQIPLLSSKLVSHSILVKSDSKSVTEDQKVTPKKLSFKTPVQSSIPEIEEGSSDEELSEEESLNEFCDVNTRKLTTLSFPKAPNAAPKPAIRKSLSSCRTSKYDEESDQDDDDDETFDSFDENFDNEDDNEGKDLVLDSYKTIYVKPPTGELVSRLTQSIEHQLQGRHSKPPAGSVDIISNVKRKDLVKQANIEHTKTEKNDDSLSSLEDQLKAFESKFQTNGTVTETHIEGSTTSSNQKSGKIDTQEQSSRRKSKISNSSWSSDDDISFEEIK